MIGDAAQYQELVTLYGSYGDDELIEMGRGMADLNGDGAGGSQGRADATGLKIAAAARAG